MEFTYQGLVRYGFGFFNPNHAAAAICILLPFIWYARRAISNKAIKTVSVAIELILYVALLFTFSRSGALALAISAIVWWFFARREDDKINFKYRRYKRALFLAIFLAVAIYAGAGSRFVATDNASLTSTTNRFTLWENGLQLFVDNIHGVGAGNSGKVVTLFYVENFRNAYRTLVNSFLTILVEHGIIAGFVLTFLIVLSLLSLIMICRKAKSDSSSATQYFAAALLSCIAGIIISGAASSCFDLNMLLSNEVIYNSTNDLLQAILFSAFGLLFFAGAVWGVYKSTTKSENIIASLIISMFICISLLAVGYLANTDSENKVIVSKEISGDYWVHSEPKDKDAKSAAFIIPEEKTDLKTIKEFFQEEIPYSSINIPLEKIDSVDSLFENNLNPQFILCGDNSSLTHLLPKGSIALFKPSVIPAESALENVTTIYLSRWDRRGDNDLWKDLQPRLGFEIQYVDF